MNRFWAILFLSVPLLGVLTFVVAPYYNIWFPKDISEHGHVIDQLFFDGVAQATGTWGAPLSGADHTNSMFMGSGFLRVMASGASPGAVPEPGTVLLLVTAVFVLGADRRRRS